MSMYMHILICFALFLMYPQILLVRRTSMKTHVRTFLHEIQMHVHIHNVPVHCVAIGSELQMYLPSICMYMCTVYVCTHEYTYL